MEVFITQKKAAFRFHASSDTGSVDIIANPELSGPDAEGMRPMELLLAGLGGCMSIDTLHILKKQRHEPTGWNVIIRGWRNSDGPRAFSSIELEFHVESAGLDAERLSRAIDLSLKKYCSVAHSLADKISIDTSFTLNGTLHAS